MKSVSILLSCGMCGKADTAIKLLGGSGAIVPVVASGTK